MGHFVEYDNGIVVYFKGNSCLLDIHKCVHVTLQYFGHLMRRTDSLEKTLTLGKTEGRRRKDDGE